MSINDIIIIRLMKLYHLRIHRFKKLLHFKRNFFHIFLSNYKTILFEKKSIYRFLSNFSLNENINF